MTIRRIKNAHPGLLLGELINDYGLTQYRVAKAIGIGQTAIGEIIKGDRNISQEVGLLLDKFFGFSEGYFSRLQNHYDFMETKRKITKRIAKVKTCELVAC